MDSHGEGRTCTSLRNIVDALCEVEGNRWARADWSDPRRLPSRDDLIRFVDMIRAVLFPGYFGSADMSRDSMRFHVGAALDEAMQILHEQLTRGQCFLMCRAADACGAEPGLLGMSRSRWRLPAFMTARSASSEHRRQAAFEGDPALTPRTGDFLLSGLQAVISQRIAHELYSGAPLIPRITFAIP